MRRQFNALLAVLLLFCVAAVADHKLEKGVALADAVPANLKSVVDAQGLATHVVLERPETGLPLARELFRFRNPKFYPDARN